MADKPIIFSAPMVRALLDGRKTQTRRILLIIKGLTLNDIITEGIKDPTGYNAALHQLRVPRYAPGDRLWVRETWSAIMDGGWTIADARRRMFGEKIVYRADGNAYEDGDGWWPSIHMPREFSRLTLTVTDVRVQRLQEISEADARAEGIERLRSGRGFYDPTVCRAAVRFGEWTSTARQGFSRLWNSIHGPDAWDANPWVLAYSFTVQRGNIDNLTEKGGAA